MSQSDSQPDDERLRDRIEALESRVESQQETMRKLMPSRRSLLQGAGGVGLGARGMSLFGSSASAQSATPAGQIGTEANPIAAMLASADLQGPIDMSGNDIENAGAIQAEGANIKKRNGSSRERFRDRGLQVDDFEDLTEWTATQGNLESASDVVWAGEQSAKITASGGESAIIERDFDTSRDFRDRDVSVMTNVASGELIVLIRLFDGDGGVVRYNDERDNETGWGWTRTNGGIDAAGTTSVDLSDIQSISIEVMPRESADVDVNIDDMRTHPKPDKGAVVLTHDDMFSSHFNDRAPILEANGMVGVFSTVPDRIDDADTMDVSQLRELQERGHSIISETFTHPNPDNLTSDGWEQELRKAQTWHFENQLWGGLQFLTVPTGNSDGDKLSVTHERFDMARMTTPNNSNNRMAISEPGRVSGWSISSGDLSQAQDNVDVAAEHKQLCVINFHEHLSLSDYEALIEHIADADVDVLTWSDVWETLPERHRTKSAGSASTVMLSSSESIPSDSVTTIGWDSVTDGNAGLYDAAQSGFVVPTDGVFFAAANVTWSGTSPIFDDDRVQLRLSVNGSTVREIDPRGVNSGDRFAQEISTVIELSEGDVITCRVFQDSGTDVSVRGEPQSWFSLGHLIEK